MANYKKMALIESKYTFLKSPFPREFKCAKTFAKFLKPKCIFKKN